MTDSANWKTVAIILIVVLVGIGGVYGGYISTPIITTTSTAISTSTFTTTDLLTETVTTTDLLTETETTTTGTGTSQPTITTTGTATVQPTVTVTTTTATQTATTATQATTTATQTATTATQATTTATQTGTVTQSATVTQTATTQMPVTVNTDKSQYSVGDFVSLSGTVYPVTVNQAITIEIKRPDGSTWVFDTIMPISNGSWSVSNINIVRTSDVVGTYTVRATYGSLGGATTTFTVG